MRVLITGITGMIGTHLAEHLMSHNCEVAGISRATSSLRQSRAKAPYKHYAGDILDVNFVNRVVKEWQPQVVYHLAAQAYNGLSWEAEQTTYAMNITGSWNVFNACLDHAPGVRVIPACSSAEYGFVEDENGWIDEDKQPLRPITPYGVSKAAMEMMARQFHLNFKLDVVLPRLFIHVGPNHPPVTALQNFARQLASIKLGLFPPVIRVGNLESSRDFVDGRDGAAALWVLARHGASGEVYNQCTGKAWSMQESLDMMIKISGLEVKVETDPALFRPSDEKVLRGNPAKINALGWKATTPFETTLRDVYQNWLERLQS